MCSNGATTIHHSFLVIKRSSVPSQLWVNLSAGLALKNPCLDSNQGSVNPPPSLWNTHPTTTGKTRPQTTRRQFCSQWKYMWCSQMLMDHPAQWRGSPLCLWHSSSTETDRNSSAKCRAVKKMSEKDSSVTTFSNLNLQVKRNINCLFMSSPPTADWCTIQLKVALKCKVGVIICLKYFGSF